MKPELLEGDKPVCAQCLDREWGKLKERNQSTLVNFLSTDIELAFTLLETSRTAAEQNHMAHARSALDKARAALVSVRSLTARVADPLALERINGRTGELEKAIDARAASIGERNPK